MMIRTFLTDIRAFWGNGSRWLLIAFFGFLASLLIFVSVSILAYTLRDPAFHPMNYENPQHVVNPILHPGDPLIVETDGKCNNSDKPLNVQPVSGSPIYRNLDTQELFVRVGVVLQAAVKPPGCPFLHFENKVPSDIPPGRYRLEGTEVATDGTKEQRVAWFTEDFTLLGE